MKRLAFSFPAALLTARSLTVRIFSAAISMAMLILNPMNLFAEESANVTRDLEYARVDGHVLRLDLHLPNRRVLRNSDGNGHQSPCIVWVHGGAWRSGSKAQMPLESLVAAGFAIASVDYRLSPVARFPAQVHDIKAAIRYLRRNSQKLGISTSRIGIAGLSAGGHLAALVGVTGGNKRLEGSVGDCLDESSDVQAIADYYGPTNFHTILTQSTPHGLSVRLPALKLLLGDTPDKQTELATLASPVNHVDKDDPPLLLVHGDQDPQVPINQAHELHGVYKSQKLPVAFEVVHGGAHGGKRFWDERRSQIVTRFFIESLELTDAMQLER